MLLTFYNFMLSIIQYINNKNNILVKFSENDMKHRKYFFIPLNDQNIFRLNLAAPNQTYDYTYRVTAPTQ